MLADDHSLTLWVILLSIGSIVLSVLMLRRRQKQRLIGWVPWNGLLFVSIIGLALALAHLFGVKGR